MLFVMYYELTERKKTVDILDRIRLKKIRENDKENFNVHQTKCIIGV